MILLFAFMLSGSYAQCYMDLPKEDLSDKEIRSMKKMREELTSEFAYLMPFVDETIDLLGRGKKFLLPMNANMGAKGLVHSFFRIVFHPGIR